MATIIGNAKECRKRIKELIIKIEDKKYEIDNIVMKVGIEETEPIRDETGSLVRNFKRSYHDTFTINYIDKEMPDLISKLLKKK